MSMFRKFRLPKLSGVDGKSDTGVDENIPRFKCNDLPVKHRLGRGSFGDVYTTVYNSETVVVKKMIQMLDQDEKKLFLKEVELLNGLKHTNIVKLKGVCCQPLAMMLQYVYFDFNVFGPADARVSSLSDFLLYIDQHNGAEFNETLNHAAEEIVNGLAYLHSRGVAHRDLKPANILVSNQHYCQLSDKGDIWQQFQSRPIACMLTDFGESRSLLVQTQSLLASKTNYVDRGTVVYMAPETLVDQMKISGATIADLFLVDVWALGMIFFSMINPSLKHPFILEMRSARQKITSQEELKIFVCSLLSQGKHPLPDKKYEVERATVWRGLEGVYKACSNFDRKNRLSLKEVATIMRQENERFLRDVDVVHLGVSQGTAVQRFDEQHARQLQDHETAKVYGNLESTLANDGTNACAFLSVKIAERILGGLTGEDTFTPSLAKAVEDTIWTLPEHINEHRDISKFYDTREAYKILSEQKIIEPIFDFSEKLPFAHTVFSLEGRQKLHGKRCHLGRANFVAVFTSDPLVLTIGCKDGKPFIIDTHPVTLAPGQGKGVILMGKQNTNEVWMSLYDWLWKRLQNGGVMPDTCQSLAVMTRRLAVLTQEDVSEAVNSLRVSHGKRPREDAGDLRDADSLPVATKRRKEDSQSCSDMNASPAATKRSKEDSCKRPGEYSATAASKRHRDDNLECSKANSSTPPSNRVGNEPTKVAEVDACDQSAVDSPINVGRQFPDPEVVAHDEVDTDDFGKIDGVDPVIIDGVSDSAADAAECLSSCEAVSYWKDNQEMPVFELGKKSRYTAREAVEVLLSLCVKKPTGDRHPFFGGSKFS